LSTLFQHSGSLNIQYPENIHYFFDVLFQPEFGQVNPALRLMFHALSLHFGTIFYIQEIKNSRFAFIRVHWRFSYY